MSRERIAVTLEPENVEWLDENCDNRSGFINKLLTRARNNEDAIDRVVARYRIEQLKRERATLESQMEGIDEQLKELETRVERGEEKREVKLEEAKEKLEGVPADPKNQAVQTWSNKLDMSPQELASKLEVAD